MDHCRSSQRRSGVCFEQRAAHVDDVGQADVADFAGIRSRELTPVSRMA